MSQKSGLWEGPHSSGADQGPSRSVSHAASLDAISRRVVKPETARAPCRSLTCSVCKFFLIYSPYKLQAGLPIQNQFNFPSGHRSSNGSYLTDISTYVTPFSGKKRYRLGLWRPCLTYPIPTLPILFFAFPIWKLFFHNYRNFGPDKRSLLLFT